MTTRAELILKVEDMLYGAAQVERPSEDVVTLADGSTTTMTVATDSRWNREDIGEIVPLAGDAGELVICAADGGSGSVTVRRAQRGTTGAAAASLVARKNPQYPRKVISELIDDVIRNRLHPHVWYRSERELTWSDNTHVYALADEDWMVLHMYQYETGEDVYVFPQGWWHEMDVDVDVEATGRYLRLARVFLSTNTVYYWARSRPLVADLTTLPDNIIDLIPWAVTADLIGGTRTVPRRHDPNRQSLAESEEGGTVRDWRYFEQRFLLRRAELHRQLRYEEKDMIQKRFKPRRRKVRSW